jgi:hypothetical protein
MEERFWSYVDKTGDCWLWTGQLHKGRGYFRRDSYGPKEPAQRVAWIIENGPIPEERWVVMTCGERACVRPSHITLRANAGTTLPAPFTPAIEPDITALVRAPEEDLRRIEERFWPRVRKTAECWAWEGKKDADGYGNLHAKFRGKNSPMRAHRISWMLSTGLEPGRYYVCHACDVPSCVRPDHLFLGDHQANMNDMYAKGRKQGRRLPIVTTPSVHAPAPDRDDAFPVVNQL